jgi:hypothetical protein
MAMSEPFIAQKTISLMFPLLPRFSLSPSRVFLFAVVVTMLFVQTAQAQETGVTLSGSILTVTDINGGSSNDNLSVSFSAGVYTITDLGGLIIGTAIPGSTGSGTSTVTVPNTGVSGINIQTLGGNDVITILSMDNLTGDFTINAGSGDDSVFITGATISLTGNGNDVNIEAERIVMNGTSPSISVTGTGLINIKANEGVSAYAAARISFTNFSLSAEDGNITLSGVSYGNVNGDITVLLRGTTSEIVTTGAGNISISGEAPDVTFVVAAIAVDGTSVRAEGTGNITFDGYSRRTSGVRFDNDSGGGAELSAIDGNITVNGETSGPNFGIWLRNDAVIETTGTGNIFLNGTGLPGNSLGIQFGLTNIMVKASGSGNIQTTGNGGFRDIRFAGGTIGDAAGTGNITFIANDYDLDYSSSIIQGAGNLFFEPLTSGATMGLGAASGAPAIPNSIINQIQPGFNSITMGDAVKTSVVIAGGANFSAANTSVILRGTTIRDLNNAGTDITSTSATGNGNLAPGASPGIFGVSGNYTFANGSTFTVEIDDAGTAGADYDQLDATGAVAIGSNVTLSLDIDPGYTATAGDEFIIVKSGTGLSGTFNGLPEGSIATNIDGLDFYISYAGGDGNDVVVKAPLPGAALGFDGSDDQVNLPFLFDPGATNFTAEAWVKPTLVDGNAHIFVQQNDGTGTGRTFLAIGSANKFYTFLGGSALSGTTTVSANTWYHVAVTWDGATLRLFVNGAEEASASASIVNADGTMILGTGKSGVLPFQGAMDEVRFWTRALCKEELLNNKNCELTGSETGLLAYYQFNQGLDGAPNPTETTLQEFSNTYDGTLTNFALTGAVSNWVKPGAVTTGVSCSAFAIANFDPAACACELGYYATLDGNGNITACTICPPGTYCPDGINQYDCAAGYFQASSGAIQCNACPPGKYQDQTGQSACLNCNQGTYNPNFAAVLCQNCPEGTFSAAQGQVSCETCEPGSIATTTGNAACVDCGNPVFAAPCPALAPVTVNAAPGACSASVALAAPTLNEDCTRNHALDFDGMDDYVDLPFLFNPSTTSFSVEAWVLNRSTASTDQVIIQQMDGNGTGRTFLGVGFTDRIYSVLGGIPTVGSTILSPNTWYHLAVTYDGTTLRLFVNGVQDAAQNRTIGNAEGPFRLGTDKNGNFSWQGSIDEVRFWNIARSEADIAATKDLEINSTYPGLIAFYNFNQGIACCDNTGLTTLPDGMGAYNGTLNGFSLTSGCTSNWVAGAPALGDPLTLVNDLIGDCGDPSGLFEVGVHTITWTATGANGQTATCAQAVTVEDNENPTINCPANITVSNDPGVCTANVTVPLPATSDNCAANALDFDGANDYVSIGAVAELVGSDYTIEGWFKIAASTSGDMIVNGYPVPGSGNYFSIEINGTGTLRFLHRQPAASSGGLDISSTTVVIGGNWHHFAAVKSGDGKIRLYVDGVLEATSVGTISNFSSAPTIELGRNSNNTRFFDGVIDEIRIWDIARTATEISNNMSMPLSGSEMNLVAYLPLDEGTACGNNTGLTTTSDLTGNYGGTLQNFNLTGSLADPCQSNWTNGFPGLSVSLTNDYNNQPTLTDDFPLGPTTVIWTATDPSGNPNTCSMTVTVNDTELPNALCKNITVNLTAPGTYTLTAAEINDNSTDNCAANLSIPPTGFDCDDVGNIISVLLTVSDGVNTDDCTAQVTVTDVNSVCNQPPTAVCQPVTVNADANCQGIAAAQDFDGGSTDPDMDPLSFSVSPSGPYSLGVTPVTLTVTDDDGATDDCTTTITVQDATPPSITCPSDITVDAAPGSCSAVVAYPQPDGVTTDLVGFYQKVSETSGNFQGVLDNGDQFGTSVASIGDLNNDGVPDLAIGVQYDDDGANDAGAVWILLMNADGTVNSETKISDNASGFPSGELALADRFGRSLAGLGDVDGDGVEDLAVGTPRDDDGGTDNGAVYILFLDTDGTVKSYNKISETQGGFTGTLDVQDEFGTGVASLGDLDGGGPSVVALAVGAPFDDDGGADRGAVWILFLDAAGNVISTMKISDSTGGLPSNSLDDDDQFGFSVAGISDINGDSYPDLAVGAILDDDGVTNRGAIYILFLDNTGLVLQTQKLSETQGGFPGGVFGGSDILGYSVTSFGDHNSDGWTDLALGMPSSNGLGQVWVLYLDENGSILDQAEIGSGQAGFPNGLIDNGDEFGWDVALIGDLNADGISDLAVSSPKDDDGDFNQGAVYILGGTSLYDNCSGFSLSQVAGLKSGSAFPVGTTTNTFTVTDANNNTSSCSFDVTVNDEEAPVITLLGLASVVHCQGTPYTDAGATATDNCDGDLTGSIVVNNPVDQNTAPGSYTVTYNVVDAMGNPAIEVTRTVIVHTCGITISDPCACKDNASNLSNGQFDETIEVNSLEGENWMVVVAPGLYQSASPAPPAAPLPVAAGTPLPEGPAGVYSLTGIHVDALGYSISVTNGSETLSISNTCYYPNPSLSGLSATYCSQDGPQVASVTADLGDASGTATVENILFELIRQSDNAVVATQSGLSATFNFDPSTLPQGLYTLRATFDAAYDAAIHPGCVQEVEEEFEVRRVGCGNFPWGGN